MSYCTTRLMGRCGNQFYQIATLIAYAKENGFDYHVPREAQNQGGVTYFHNFPFFRVPRCFYYEMTSEEFNHRPIYSPIPKIEGVCLMGYWQSFKYFDNQRQLILDSFNFPYEKLDYVSIHVRRTDYLYERGFHVLDFEYYIKAIEYFNKLGYYKFMVFSDDINFCKENFTKEKFKDSEFIYQEGNSELVDLSKMSSCQHNIVANSSFSYVASWLNQNPNKIVVTPDYQNMFDMCNVDMIPENYIKI